MKRLLLIPILLLGFVGSAQVLMTGAGSYSQDFNTLITTGTATWTDNSTLANWFGQRSGTGNTIIAGNGSTNTGGLYSFGTGTTSDRAFGDQGSGTPANLAMGVQFQNTSGSVLTNFTVSYVMEQWRDGGNATPVAQTLTFWYKVSSSPITALNPNANAGWTAVTALDGISPVFTAVASALDGNLPANRVSLTNVVIPGLLIANGGYLMLKWDDPNNPGNDHGLSVDDFSASWTTSCNTTSAFSVSACTSYTVPSGDETYTTSGVYHDTIPNAALCDSIMTITVNITGGTTSSFPVSSCTSYTVPSGDETYFVDGVYLDTIPNHLGCDSVMTITVDIVAGITYYQDFDTDGLGNPLVTSVACSQPGGYVTNSNDCNDNNNTIGLAATWYADTDGDTYGDPLVTAINCTQPMGYVANSMDCNDANAAIHPGATEIPSNGIDEDCSGGDLVPSALAQYQFVNHVCATPVVSVTAQPANATFSDYSAAGAITCASGTGYINYSGWNQTTTIDLTQYYSFTITPASCYNMNLSSLQFLHRISGSGGTPTAHVRSSLDNFASDIATLPILQTATDINEVVTLPSGQFGSVNVAVEFRIYITEMAAVGATYRNDNVSLFGFLDALPTTTFYADADGDTYGDPAVSVTDCIAPIGYVANNTDCDDNNEDEYPGATWVIDLDNDGFGGATTQTSCTQPDGYIVSSAPADCDDNNNAVQGQSTYYADTDNDGFGDANSSISACSAPGGYVSNDDDCDDSDNSIGLPNITYYMDLDGDMYGDPNSPVLGCSIQVGYSPNNLDCDDTDANINPDATEICDNIDNNCDGNTDEGLLNVAWYQDADSDGFGNSTVMVSDCAQPVGYVSVGGDCDDTDGDINPDATDATGDGIDQNCDGVDGNLSVNEDVFFEITASPNPGNDFVKVDISENFGLLNAVLVSADGRVINTPFVTVEGGIEIQTKAIVPGVYIITLTNGSITKTVRWIKQ